MAVNTNDKSIEFDAIKIGLASPERIREWSHGEVKKPETINYRTLKPERDGLFCERIFGPSKDWECHCGKYKRIRYKGVICDKCGVEVTKAKVRRERMGHIELAAPVSHIWYFKGIPSRMGTILDIAPRALEKVLYFAAYIVLEAEPETGLVPKQILEDREYRQAKEQYPGKFRAEMGAEAVQELLAAIDLEKDIAELKEELSRSTGQKRLKIIKRLEVMEAFYQSGNRPEWMVLNVVPVIPPDLRPMVQLDGGRFATSDLNDLYRRVINRNNRLNRLLKLGAPDIIVRNEKRMLQEAVDALIDNGRRGRAVTGPGNRALKSLSDMLRGKQGRFRQNLLGKRVDYSGRSVIVVGPELKIYQCGLPKEMAIELFKPFVMKKLTEKGFAHNIKSAKRMVERVQPEVWDVLDDVIREHPVMLNRAPTLHRLGIQAFEPILVEGKAIKLHPLVCAAFNADFDGDQMAVHVPLSVEAQAECRFMLLSTNNLLKPSDGAPVAVPSQDIVLGVYYLTQEHPEDIGSGRYFKDANEAILAFENHELTIHSVIKIRRTVTLPEGEIGTLDPDYAAGAGVSMVTLKDHTISGVIETTVGRIILNEKVPQDLGHVERTPVHPESYLPYEVSFLTPKKKLAGILQRCIDVHGITDTAVILDEIKSLGFHYSTVGAITMSVYDIVVPPDKQKRVKDTEQVVSRILRDYRRGLLTDDERHERVIRAWTDTDNEIANGLLEGMDKDNNIFMMIDSGARGSKDQMKQLAGMRGLMASPTGDIIELPIKSNFREGMDVLEYFISSHGARKGLSDTALRTADSGYLTRRLVDVSQDMIVRTMDCCEEGRKPKGVWVRAFIKRDREDNETVIETLTERIRGRWSIDEIRDPETGEVIVPEDTMITPEQAQRIEQAGIREVHIRNMLSCRSRLGVCSKCYGADMSTGLQVRLGEVVGIVAAQSIGEPGTQLTMRTFHSGGIAGDDITQGLPRVQELFEARKPKGLAIIAEFGGMVTVNVTGRRTEVIIEDPTTAEAKTYQIPFNAKLAAGIKTGVTIEAGDPITAGSINPHELLKIRGIEAVQDYLIKEVQNVYRVQGVDINDKHIEIIVRQMLKRVRVEDGGETDMLPGNMVDFLEFEAKNQQAEEEGKEPATGERVLLGITKAALATDSFLSAASFQETTKVLTEAAIKGKVDPLLGLKENVIIGKLIPAGTGMNQYQRTQYILNGEPEIPAESPEAEDELVDDDLSLAYADEDDVYHMVLSDDFDNENNPEDL